MVKKEIEIDNEPSIYDSKILERHALDVLGNDTLITVKSDIEKELDVIAKQYYSYPINYVKNGFIDCLLTISRLVDKNQRIKLLKDVEKILGCCITIVNYHQIGLK